MSKGKSEPINIRSALKDFLESRKLIFKNRVGKFVGMSEILMYYLEDSKLFINDYSEYCGDPIIEKCDVLQFIDDDLLGLLTKK